MSAWRPLLLLLLGLFFGISMTVSTPEGPSPTDEAVSEPPKPWGTMDGKSPFRLIASDGLWNADQDR